MAHDRSHHSHSQELLLLVLPLLLLATGILNDLPGLTSCCCDNVGLVSLFSWDGKLPCLISLYYVIVIPRWRGLYVIYHARPEGGPRDESDKSHIYKPETTWDNYFIAHP